jgi:RNA polymerase sigma-70 factor (ECF subfamily)
MSTGPEDDRELIRLCVAGDGGAWSEFVRRYLRLVVHVVRTTLREKTGRASEEDVDDVAEEFYARLVDQDFRALRTLREPFHLKAWLAVGARHKALDHVKKRTLRAVSLDQPADVRGEGQAIERLVGFTVDPSSDVGEEVRRAVDEAPLNAKERLLIVLFFFKEKRYDEIARIVGIPENSIGPTVRRALEKIRETLAKRGVK